MAGVPKGSTVTFGEVLSVGCETCQSRAGERCNLRRGVGRRPLPPGRSHAARWRRALEWKEAGKP